PGGAAPVLLEEREVGTRSQGDARGPPGVLGVARVQQPWRSLEGRAVQRGLVTGAPAWQLATVTASHPETAKVKSFTFPLPPREATPSSSSTRSPGPSPRAGAASPGGSTRGCSAR